MNQLPPYKVDVICRMIREGRGDNAIARVIRCHQRVIARRRAALRRLKFYIPSCGCGRDVTHKGNCRPRLRGRPLWRDWLVV